MIVSKPARRRVNAVRAVTTVAASCSVVAALAQPQSGPPTQVAAPAAAASAPAPAPQRVEVIGGRESDTDLRRQSTAAKIVIGREELDRFGDSTVGEVLKRLPGITIPGPAGRGGSPRMRGLGGGYTQLLIDGQRVPPGFSLESLTPEQIERIEILRAPTAETGARAIGGTINIVTREGYKRYLNDLRLGVGYENGQATPGVRWTYNDHAGDLTYNLAASVFRNQRAWTGRTETLTTDRADGRPLRELIENADHEDRRLGLHLSSRLQWRLGGGDSLMLMPVLFHHQGEGVRRYVLEQTQGDTPAPYARATSDPESRFTVGRVNMQWKQRLGEGVRLETTGGGSLARSRNRSTRQEFDAAGALLRTLDDDSRTRERSLTLNTKLSTLLGASHDLVGGLELEDRRRSETRTELQDSEPLPLGLGDNLQASSRRVALYAQDEWAVSPHWAAHAGLRWEGITTDGDAGDGSRPARRSSVTTPLVHLVWKPDPKVRDQVRLSLTRSYKSPTLQNLLARPVLSSRYPAQGTNLATSPDRAGNADLRPELARGIDLAVERYLDGGGVLSANLFQRRITDYIRNVTTLENVSWSPVPRWVTRPQNVGSASTRGLELDAKFRLDQAVDGAWPVELRANLSLFRSRVDSVPGPDNRLDEQPAATANLGADYRLRGLPLTLGGSLNWTPGYRTRISTEQAVEVSGKRQFDAYALWAFTPAVQLRLLASNLAQADHVSTSTQDADFGREQARSISPTDVNWQLRLELKL